MGLDYEELYNEILKQLKQLEGSAAASCKQVTEWKNKYLSERAKVAELEEKVGKCCGGGNCKRIEEAQVAYEEIHPEESDGS